MSDEILPLIDFDKTIWWEHWIRSGSSSGEHPPFTEGSLVKEVYGDETIVSLYYSLPNPRKIKVVSLLYLSTIPVQAARVWRLAVRGVDHRLAAEQCLLARAKSRATDLARHPEWLE